MAELGDILASLKITPKGKLKYDKRWVADDLQDILEECTSPPQVMTVSSSKSFLQHCVSPSVGISPTPCKPGGIVYASLSYIEDEEGSGEEETAATPVSLKMDKIDASERSSPSPSKTAKNKANAEEWATPPKERTSPLKERNSPPKESLIQSPQAAITEVTIKDYEDNWQKEVEAAVERRRQIFQQHNMIMERAAEKKALEMQLQQEKETQAAVHRAQQQQILRSEEVKKKNMKLREHHRQHKKMLETKMKEAEERKKHLEEEARKRNEENRQRLASVFKSLQDAQTYQASIDQLLAKCQYPNLLNDVPTKCRTLIVQIIEKLNHILSKAQEGEVQDDHIKVSQELFKKVTNIVGVLKEAVESANKQGKDAEEKKKADDAKAAADAAKAAQAATAAAAAASMTPKSDEVLCISEASFKEYKRLQDLKEQTQKSYQPLVDNVPLKKYRFDLKKAVNIPVNAISPTSGAHLRDKLKRILEVLGGQHVDVGGRRVSANENVTGVAFVKDLFAEKIVDQGNTQVASNYESAFAIAGVAVGVWCEMPDVGDLILAHFHSKCPYTVPYYKPKLPQQSEEDFYRSLGYTYEGGTVEQQDKFLKRMSGLMRLYASIMVSVPPRGPQHPHPHGVEDAWAWLTYTLNLEPRPDITATMIHDFLQVTGNLLWKTYGKQFLKLLRIVCTDYLPKIQAVTLQGSGGPVTRLETYLQKCINSGRIAPPEGVLPANFWTSR